jgi:hypothetical protein
MLSRRLFVTALLAVSASAWIVEAAGAQGKGASSGGGGGNSNAGSGNGAGGGGNPNAGGGGNGAGGGNSNAGGGNEEESEQPTQSVEQPSAVPENYATTAPGPLRVRHRNGFEEEIGAGRYKMLDNRGRLIVDRAVRSSDYARLRRLTE